MSAHLCSTNDIHAIVDWARSISPGRPYRLPVPPAHYASTCGFDLYGAEYLDPCHATAFGRCLLLANWESLRARYRERAAEHFGNGEGVSLYLARRCAFMYGATPGKAAEEIPFILKQLDHYDYQASEVENYRETWAGRVIAQLRHEAISRLPAYKAAPWGLD